MALITPEKLAASGTEDGTQTAYIQACRVELQKDFPAVRLIYHVPNGGQRGDARSAQITMARMKAMGLVPGVPDVCLPVSRCGYSSLYIEFKKPDGKGSLSSEQYDYIKLLTSEGNLVAIVDDWYHAFQVTEMYLKGHIEELKLLVNKTEIYSIRALHLIDVAGYVEKLIMSKAYQKIKK